PSPPSPARPSCGCPCTSWGTDMALITMYDSVTAWQIPPDAPAVAGYVDGMYCWSAQDWARFPNALKVTIATSAAHDAMVLDVERWDATPDEAPGWIARQRQ